MTKPRLVALAITAITLNAAAHAAPVTFAKPVIISGEADVLTVARLDRAVNFGGSELSVNGVLFGSGNIGSGSGSVDIGFNTLDASAGNVVYLNDAPTFAAAGEPYDSLPEAYKTLLASGCYANTTHGTLTLTLNQLQQGAAYTVQFFANDARDFHGGNRMERVSSGGATSDPLKYSSTGTGGGVGQFVTGTFIADGPTQMFVFAPVNPMSDDAQINAFELRIMPAAEVRATPSAHKNK